MATPVRPLKIHEVSALHRLFLGAIDGSFAYIDAPYRQKIVRDNNKLRLAIACLHPKRLILVTEAEGELTGYAIGAVDNGQANLYWLYVAPEHRGSQIGIELLGQFETASHSLGARRVGLSTYDHQNYYSKLGYAISTHEQLHGKPMKIMVKDIH